jgi:hypothetical protein
MTISGRAGTPNETELSPASVAGESSGILANVIATGDIGAQPLIVQGVSIANNGVHDVVYIVTSANNVQGFDAISGQKLLSVNLGALPPKAKFTNPIVVGISSTPVIDTTQNAIFLVSCTNSTSALSPTWCRRPWSRLHPY